MLLVTPQGAVTPTEPQDAEPLLRENGAVGQVVNLHIVNEDSDLLVTMAIDPAQPINSKARSLLDQLAALHMMCFGPVVVQGLDAETERELTRG